LKLEASSLLSGEEKNTVLAELRRVFLTKNSSKLASLNQEIIVLSLLSAIDGQTIKKVAWENQVQVQIC